jgi:hypothetical protein
MSAFMVEDQTINTIVNWLRTEIPNLSYIPYKLRDLGIDTFAPGWEEQLGQAMFELNIKGVEARYGTGEAASFRVLDYSYTPAPAVPLVQTLKSLQCWLCQCSEGDVPETKLYKLFDHDVQLYLMEKIIDTLPEYQQAVWG